MYGVKHGGCVHHDGVTDYRCCYHGELVVEKEKLDSSRETDGRVGEDGSKAAHSETDVGRFSRTYES